MEVIGMWVYIRTEPGVWTVGFYGPDGKWQPDSDQASQESAAARVHYLNGGNDELSDALSRHQARLSPEGA